MIHRKLKEKFKKGVKKANVPHARCEMRNEEEIIYSELREKVKECVKKANIPPRYEPYKWEGKEFNCYMYVLEAYMDFSDYYTCRIAPGFLSRGEKNDYKDTKEDTIQYFMEDCKILNLNISETTLDEEIAENEYKIAVYIEKNWDYHFIRQDSDGNWSEKDGWQGQIRIVNNEYISNETLGKYKYIGMFKVSKKKSVIEKELI